MMNKVERANKLYLRKLAAKGKAKAIVELVDNTGKKLTKTSPEDVKAASKGFAGNVSDIRGITFKPSNESNYVVVGVDPTITRTMSINPDGGKFIHNQLINLPDGKTVVTKVKDTLKSGALPSLVPGASNNNFITAYGVIPADPTDKVSAALGKLVSKADEASDAVTNKLTTRGSKLWGATKDKGKKVLESVKKHPIIASSLAVLGGGSGLTYALLSDSDKEDNDTDTNEDTGKDSGKKSDDKGFKHWGALGGGAVGGIGAALAAWELSKNRAEWERWLYTGLAAAGGATAGGFAGSMLDGDDDEESKDSK